LSNIYPLFSLSIIQNIWRYIIDRLNRSRRRRGRQANHFQAKKTLKTKVCVGLM
jgi:hypothetical protein